MRYMIHRHGKEKETENDLVELSPEQEGVVKDEVSFLALRTLAIWPLGGVAFDFAHPASQEEVRLPWYEGPLDEGFQLMEEGADLHDVMTHVIGAFTAFGDLTFQEENEPALNSILRALVRFHDRELQPPREGPVQMVQPARLRQFGRNMAELVRGRWHWLRCPRAMENRAAEAHLRRLGLEPGLSPPEDYWQEELERRHKET